MSFGTHGDDTKNGKKILEFMNLNWSRSPMMSLIQRIIPWMWVLHMLYLTEKIIKLGLCSGKCMQNKISWTNKANNTYQFMLMVPHGQIYKKFSYRYHLFMVLRIAELVISPPSFYNVCSGFFFLKNSVTVGSLFNFSQVCGSLSFPPFFSSAWLWSGVMCCSSGAFLYDR